MKEYFNRSKPAICLLLLCFLISFFLNRNCVPDEYCDPDPLYGGCGSVCSYDNFSFLKFFTNAIGLFMFGYIAKYILSEGWKKE
jgi:hypothetical protein